MDRTGLTVPRGILANWFDMPTTDTREFEAWHNHTHMPERLAVEGFLRARRYVAVGKARPGYSNLVLYETATINDLFSDAYAHHKQNPSPTTARLRGALKGMNRQVFADHFSASMAVGGYLVTVLIERGPDFGSSRPVERDALLKVLSRDSQIVSVTCGQEHPPSEGGARPAVWFVEATTLAAAQRAAETLGREGRADFFQLAICNVAARS
ncbi:MAG: hypothetical protein VX874_09435 [Pseudomonadota bacterium]|nr:hypothetical protein [Pseudomonadota bacterium]